MTGEESVLLATSQQVGKLGLLFFKKKAVLLKGSQVQSLYRTFGEVYQVSTKVITNSMVVWFSDAVVYYLKVTGCHRYFKSTEKLLIIQSYNSCLFLLLFFSPGKGNLAVNH